MVRLGDKMLGTIRDMLSDKDDRFIILLTVILVVFFTLMIYGIIQEHKEWDVFREKHNCKVVSRISWTTATGFSNGNGGKGGSDIITTYIPEKIGWQCDDGITYYR